jgi:hypothetical protein
LNLDARIRRLEGQQLPTYQPPSEPDCKPLSWVARVLTACSEIRPEPDPFNDFDTWQFDYFFSRETVDTWARYAELPQVSEGDVAALRQVFADAGAPERFLTSITEESATELWKALRRFQPRRGTHWESSGS